MDEIKFCKNMQKLGFIKRATYKGKMTKKAEFSLKAIKGMAIAFSKYNVNYNT